MAVPLTTWLSTRSPAQLAGLLAARPDTLAPPAPGNLAELAERLAMPSSITTALHQLPLPAIQLIEVLQLLGPTDGRQSTLADWLGCDPADPGLTETLRLLSDQALLWPDGDTLRMVEPLYRTFRYPLGLGEPAGKLLTRCSLEQLRSTARQLALPSGGRKADLIATILTVLSDGDQVRTLVAQADQRTRHRLAELAGHGPVTDQFAGWYAYQQIEPALRWAAARGLVLTDEWGVPQPPREVGRALRGAGWHAPFQPGQPALSLVEVAPSTVEREAAAAGGGAVDQLTALLATMEAEPVSLLKSGGVGVRELRRLARVTGLDESVTRLWLEIAYEAELVAPVRDRSGTVRLLPTAGYDSWAAATPADQLAAVLPVWVSLPASPLEATNEEREKPPPALIRTQFGQQAATVRRLVLLAAASLPVGRAVADPAELPAVVRWQSPLQVSLAATTNQLVTTAWQEARLVAVIAHGAITAPGRALAGQLDPHRSDRADPTLATHERTLAALAEACRALLPAATTEAVFQADLTALVPGSPDRTLAELLDAAADRESGGGAVTWRFTGGSVRRAMDTGWQPDQLSAALRERAVGRALPQPLTYLIADVARRHGQIRARAVNCVLRAEDPALIAELASARALRSLRLSAIAPTVLAAAAPLDETLAALRAAGYAPVAESDDGVPQLTRIARPRAERPGRRHRQPAPDPAHQPLGDLRAIAERLLTAPLPPRPPAPRQPAEPTTGWAPANDLELPRPASPDLSIESHPDLTPDLDAALASFADQLTLGEQQLLADAIDTAQPVTITYTNAQGNRSVRVIDSIELIGEHLVAWCQLRQDERMFALHRIVSVLPAPDNVR